MPVNRESIWHESDWHVRVTGTLLIHLQVILACILSPCMPVLPSRLHRTAFCPFFQFNRVIPINSCAPNMDNNRSELNKIVLLLAIECVAKLLKNKKKRRRRVWVRDWISRREDFGASSCLLHEMRLEDHDGYRNHLRMLPEKFDELLGKIENKITKNNTQMRNAIPAKTKLEITLRFLATGDSFTSLEALYRVGKSTISQFVPVVSSEIATALKDFIKVSKNMIFIFFIYFSIIIH